MPDPSVAQPARTTKEQFRRYVVAMTIGGVVIGGGSLTLPAMIGLGAPALLGAAILTVLLGRSIGPLALVAPLVPAAIWAVVLVVLIVTTTEPASDDRALSSVFAFLAIAIVAVGGVLCAGLGAAWRASSGPPAGRRGPGPDQTSAL